MIFQAVVIVAKAQVALVSLEPVLRLIVVFLLLSGYRSNFFESSPYPTMRVFIFLWISLVLLLQTVSANLLPGYIHVEGEPECKTTGTICRIWGGRCIIDCDPARYFCWSGFCADSDDRLPGLIVGSPKGECACAVRRWRWTGPSLDFP